MRNDWVVNEYARTRTESRIVPKKTKKTTSDQWDLLRFFGRHFHDYGYSLVLIRTTNIWEGDVERLAQQNDPCLHPTHDDRTRCHCSPDFLGKQLWRSGLSIKSYSYDKHLRRLWWCPSTQIEQGVAQPWKNDFNTQGFRWKRLSRWKIACRGPDNSHQCDRQDSGGGVRIILFPTNLAKHFIFNGDLVINVM